MVPYSDTQSGGWMGREEISSARAAVSRKLGRAGGWDQEEVSFRETRAVEPSRGRTAMNGACYDGAPDESGLLSPWAFVSVRVSFRETASDRNGGHCLRSFRESLGRVRMVPGN